MTTAKPSPAASVARGLARSRARRIGQHGVSTEARQQRWDRWGILRCGHRVGERPEHDAQVCRAVLDVTLDGWLAEIPLGKGA